MGQPHRYELVATRRFERQLASLDRQIAKRVLARLYGLTELAEPSTRCKPLAGPLVGLCRLRIGDRRAAPASNKAPTVATLFEGPAAEPG